MISENPHLLVSPDGMGLISDIRPIGAIRELPFYDKLIMELVGSLATIGYVGDFVDDPDMTQLLKDIKDLFLDIVYLSRWWFQIFFYFHPYLGKIPILTNIFQMGWNHQLAMTDQDCRFSAVKQQEIQLMVVAEGSF